MEYNSYNSYTMAMTCPSSHPPLDGGALTRTSILHFYRSLGAGAGLGQLPGINLSSIVHQPPALSCRPFSQTLTEYHYPLFSWSS